MNRVIFLLFFCSGATSLIYEVLWMRRLSLIFGHSIFSVSTVLTTFMTGLALGSFFAGRWSDKVRSKGKGADYFLACYGRLEFFIGLWALLTLSLLAGVEHAYFSLAALGYGKSALSAFVFLSAFMILLPPTVAMGATLPVFTQILVMKRADTGRFLSQLYGFNTLGACVGAAVGGVFLLPTIGFTMSVVLGASVNTGIALIALIKAPRMVEHVNSEVVEKASAQIDLPLESPIMGSILPIVFGISGFTGMVYQLAWTRALVLTVGSSTYSFSLILTAFLAALSVGSLVYRSLFSSRAPMIADLARLQIFIGLTALVSTQGMGWFPVFKVWALRNLVQTFWASVALDFSSVFVLLFLPTLALGLTFPLVTHLYTSRIEVMGKSLGEAYASNTVGAILGSFLGGFILIPTWGAQNSVHAAVFLNIVGASVLLLHCFRRTADRPVVSVGMALGTIVLSLLAPAWNQSLMSSGPSVYRSASTLRKPHFYRDGITSTVTVALNGESQVFLAVNGKVDASLAERDRQTQLLLGLVPSALHPAPRNVGVVGFGSGQTVVGLLSNPKVEKVICAELEPAVLEAQKFFRSYSEGYFDDPRLHIVVDDGRTFILGSAEKFDLIVSEPSNPWIAGIGNLYTVEFYQGCRAKLESGGMMCQWFHLYFMTEDDVNMVLRTFYSVFPEGQLFRTSGGDILLVGSEAEVKVRPELLDEIWRTDSLARWFYSFGLVRPEMFYSTYLGTRHDVMLHLEETSQGIGNGSVNTDDLPLLEFQAPLALFRSDSVIPKLDNIFPLFAPPDLKDNPSVVEASLLGRALLGFPFDLNRGLAKLEAIDPGHTQWTPQLFEFFVMTKQAGSGDLQPMLDNLVQGESWVKHVILACLKESGSSIDTSILTQVALNEHLVGSAYTLNFSEAQRLEEQGQYEEAKEYFEAAARLTQSDRPFIELAKVESDKGLAKERLDEAIRRNPFSAESRLLLAKLYFDAGQNSQALEQAEESHRLYGLNPDTAKLLSEVYQKLGRQNDSVRMSVEWGRLKSLAVSKRKIP